MLLGNSLLPITALCFKRLRRSIGVMLVISLLINVGMFIERFLIIVPSLSHKNMPFVWGYRPLLGGDSPSPSPPLPVSPCFTPSLPNCSPWWRSPTCANWSPARPRCRSAGPGFPPLRERSSAWETLGIFNDVESAARAVERLVRAGFTEAQITSLSSVPYPDGVLVRTNRRTRFRWVALAGGCAGAVAGFSLAAGTAWLYPVQTGDKPIIALFPTGIVTYEVTMLFAMIGTIVGMFLEMRLPALGKRLYDPAIAEGCIGICLSIHPGGEPVTCEPGVRPEECIGGDRLPFRPLSRKSGQRRS